VVEFGFAGLDAAIKTEMASGMVKNATRMIGTSRKPILNRQALAPPMIDLRGPRCAPSAVPMVIPPTEPRAGQL
jgi:hypothetical protein